ncbi:calpain family cysteine protease (macronuclear) [Tetrahymena thermophila SB210]|uniref:Calpain family cysteine protease n=1 Tax=Tetrahymena thermophila (strain SB210) TaxID=312017 RepID=I7MA48_TETTS|nr:calpain family cysteine protease [Tetrahymena thermophila SB210]EAS03714.1 calpain family cysteine protease [Tetrahymena thermophila SB210]|eukprot:XP_001023959.1 calpain family cysteine protease [Tetrahymena thermophila SB210]
MVFQVKNLKYLLICLIIKVSFQSLDQIYSPFYLTKLDFSDTQNPLRIKLSSSCNLVFIATGYSGITISDRLLSGVLLSQKIGNQYINAFDVSRDCKYIFFGLQQQVQIFELVKIGDSNYQLIEISSQQFKSQVQSIILLETSQVLIACGSDGNVAAYDVSDIKNPLTIGNYNTGSTIIPQISSSIDELWLYVSCERLGTQIFQLSLVQDQQTLKRQIKFTLAAQGKGQFKGMISIATNNNSFIFQVDTWNGLFYANIQNLSSQTNNYPVDLSFNKFNFNQKASESIQSLALSQDNQLLFLGVRSEGMYVFDIRDLSNVQLFQQIQVDSHSLSIEFSADGNYLYFSNALSVFLFERTQVNLNDNFPNLFNIHQTKNEPMADIEYKWSCLIDSTNTYMLGAFDHDGMYIFPYYGDPYKLKVSTAIYYNVGTDSIIIDPQSQYMYVLSLNISKLITIFKISDPSNPNISLQNIQEVSSYTMDGFSFSEYMIFSSDRQFAIVTYETGMLLFDTSNPLQLKLLQYWQNPASLAGENQGAAITKDNKWIFGTVRFYGLYLLDASDKNNLKLVDQVNTLGGENIILSDILQYAYLIDGVRGFAIIDLSALPKIVIISRVPIQGYCNSGMLLQNDNFILTVQMDNGFVTLVDMRDKLNPFVLSSYSYGQEFATYLCGPKTGEYIFVTNPQRIIAIPLTSKVKIHTQANQVTIDKLTGQKTTVKINPQLGSNSSSDYTFYVGQTIELSFSVLYPFQSGMQVVDVFSYTQGQIASLPSYAFYDNFKKIISMYVDKQALGSQENSSNLNTVLIKTAFPLTSDLFVYQSEDGGINDLGITNEAQALQIFQFLISQKVIDSNYFVSTTFDSPCNFEFGDYLSTIMQSQNQQSNFGVISDQITEKVCLTLMRAYYINPIIFNVKPSLLVNFTNPQQYISSLSTDIIDCYLQVDKNSGRFVLKTYDRVITSISEQQDQIKIEGSLAAVNAVLQNQIMFANSTALFMDDDAQNSQQTLNLTLVDGVNYPLIINRPINKCKFITLKKKLKVNPEKTLQMQFDRQFPDSEVPIETQIYFEFASDTFIVEDSKQITYYIQYNDGNSYQNLTTSLWLQQSGSQLSYNGFASSSIYREVFTFKIIASDGYTQAEDYFTIKVYAIPFSLLFNILMKILGPLFAVLGLYQKRGLFLSMCFRRKVEYSSETIFNSQLYQKKIVILSDINIHSRIITNNIFSKIISCSKSNEKKSEISVQKDKSNQIMLLNFNQTQECRDRIINNQNFIFNKKQIEVVEQTKLLLVKTSQHYKRSFIEQRYLKESGGITMTQVVQDILQYNFLASPRIPNLTQQVYQSELINSNSRIHKAIHSQLSRQILNLDKRSLLIYECLQNIGKLSEYYTKNDWYKYIVNINYTDEINIKSECEQQNNVFPHLNLNIDMLVQILAKIGIISIDLNLQFTFGSLEKFVKEQELGINLRLIRDVIFADALGFCSYKPSPLQPSIGESIHLPPYSIKQVLAYQKVNYNFCIRPLIKLLNLEYQRYAAYENNKLPNWLSLDQKQGLLFFHGVPDISDSQEILIRIFDSEDYVIQQFLLKIEAQKITFPNNIANLSIPDEQEYISQVIGTQKDKNPTQSPNNYNQDYLKTSNPFFEDASQNLQQTFNIGIKFKDGKNERSTEQQDKPKLINNAQQIYKYQLRNKKNSTNLENQELITLSPLIKQYPAQILDTDSYLLTLSTSRNQRSKLLEIERTQENQDEIIEQKKELSSSQ